ncbi:PASTA domain-containing protein [Clostridiaceae bacterium NSJ-31]|uniref:PASTA domain-containing protein n=1 Tax=Ligaoa zhengdingensis TaxID=2763658 RepID=A0A926I5C8_9FIRM|nr:penicillin-binding transpeptidase domain-containing protein [Ligaoa zhengdingensis]MBC8547146.1 PASTA domain-containing protein [Ligaoa zhengdingensis]
MAVTGPSSKMKRRMMVCMALLCVFGTLGLLVRLFTLQVVDAAQYQRKAAEQQLREADISPKRGFIYDRNMKTLAKSATVWTVVLSPSDISDKRDSDGNIVRSAEELRYLIADGLSEILGVDRETIIEKSHRKTYYEIIKRRVERSVADQVLEFASENDITCINLEEDNKRYYPYGSLASTVLGFTGSENHGAYGLEAKYDSVLSGTPGRVVSAKNAWGTDMPFQYNKMYPAEDGNSIVLTIDETIQHFVEKHLETAVKEHNVQARATCIVMDPNTGEVLAMATKNDFDPNDPYTITDPLALAKLAELDPESDEYADLKLELQYDQWRNKAISDPYEPGSVFKLITAASALEEGAVDPDHFSYTCSGSIQIANKRISCWKGAGHGTQNFTEIMMHSCNPGFITVGQMLGADKFTQYREAFGLQEKTGIDLPGEAGNAGLYHSRDLMMANNPSVELASESFGQTFKVTPIQLITAVSAVINGGKLMQPHLVKQIIDSDGNIVENIEPVVKRQVISEETSRQVALMAEQVVGGVGGSGKNAYIPGYRVGGKTGTSEKLDSKNEAGEVDKRISSFLGFAPANDPQVICLLMLDEPYMSNPFGSVIAAPVVGAILSETLPYLGVEPQYTEEELAKVDIKVPDVVGKGTLDAYGIIGPLGLEYEVIGEGTTVIKQTPKALTSVPKGSKVLLYTDTQSLDEMVEVPNVVGMTAQQANVALVDAKLNIKLAGATDGVNTAAKQSIEAGTLVEPGTVVTVQFISNDTAD